jgi:hypothetical protein
MRGEDVSMSIRHTTVQVHIVTDSIGMSKEFVSVVSHAYSHIMCMYLASNKSDVGGVTDVACWSVDRI